MSMATVKRLAAGIFGTGVRRVRVSPERVKETEKTMTRSDVENLIKNGVITKLPVKGRRKNKPRKRKGSGSRKGAWKARAGDKDVWMAKVRSQRKLLRALLDEGALDPKHKRKLYRRIKSGLFKSKRVFIAYLKEAGMVKQDYEPEKGTGRKAGARKKAAKAKETKPETGKPETAKEEDKA